MASLLFRILLIMSGIMVSIQMLNLAIDYIIKIHPHLIYQFVYAAIMFCILYYDDSFNNQDIDIETRYVWTGLPYINNMLHDRKDYPIYKQGHDKFWKFQCRIVTVYESGIIVVPPWYRKLPPMAYQSYLEVVPQNITLRSHVMWSITAYEMVDIYCYITAKKIYITKISKHWNV
eukprot:38751_1